eukprot:UN04441
MANLNQSIPSHPIFYTITQRSSKKCIHNELRFRSCVKYVNFIVNCMINNDGHKNILCDGPDGLIWCQQCISEFLSNSIFLNRFNNYLKKVLISSQKSMEEFNKNINCKGFGAFIKIMYSLLDHPKITKLIFNKYWKL